MPVTSDPDRWTGRSGRVYTRLPDDGIRDGGMATIHRIAATGSPSGTSSVPPGAVLALKLARQADKLAMEALEREAEMLAALSKAPGSPPCPRLYDVVGEPPLGLVMEWCPTDMERWWETAWSQPKAFLALTEALADTCRRVREYEAVAEMDMRRRVIHADIKPRNLLRAVDGRWLLTDFGASKSRSVDDAQWTATRIILGTENFIAPEAVFNARKPHPAAMDTWSVGCTFYALLRMRTWMRSGQRMPPNGTHAHAFRTQRVALITDLQQRKPNLFADRALDPAQFTSPERMPDKDRKAVHESLDGIFGDTTNTTLEGVLAGECLNLLDRALRIDPAGRFRDPLEMAAEFEALAQRFRELSLRAEGGTANRYASAPAGAPRPVAEAPAPSPQSAPPAPPVGAPSAPRFVGNEEIVVEEGSGRRSAATVGPSRGPGWVGLGLGAIVAMQGLQLLVGVATLVTVMRAEPSSAPAPTNPSAPAASGPVASGAPAARAPQAVLAELPEPTAEPSPVATEATGAPATTRGAASQAPKEPSRASDPRRVGTPAAAKAGDGGLVLVSGGQAYLLGPSGRQPTGTVPTGTYELFVQAGTSPEFVSMGQVSVATGERVVYRCGLGTCKRVQ